jgi:hypothetical protein
VRIIGSAEFGSVLALTRQSGAVEGFAGGDDCEVELFEQFFWIVLLHRIAGWPVDGGDSLQSDAHGLKGLRVHITIHCVRFGIMLPRGAWAVKRGLWRGNEGPSGRAPGALPARGVGGVAVARQRGGPVRPED